MKRLMGVLLMFAALACCAAAPAADRGSAEEAVAMVKLVIADIRKHGKDQVIQDVQNQAPRYHDRDLYVTIGNMDGVALANGANPKLAGRNLIDLRDVDGVYIHRVRIELAKTKGAGWYHYKWPDPITKRIQQKSMYIERFDDVIVSCGIYKD